MDIKHISPSFAVTPQIDEADVRRAVDAGFTTIICNRPDGEAEGQPSSATIAAAANKAGAGFHYLPVKMGQAGEDMAEKLSEILKTVSGPVLGYCGSGNRAAGVWENANKLNA